MKMRNIMISCLLITFVFLSCLGTVHASDKPNIVLVFMHNFGWGEPGFMERNWTQTIPGKGWFVLLRLYSPLMPWYDQTWRPSEIELVK